MSERKDRMRKFVIDLAAYCYHPAVARMTQQQRGALLFLLHAMWQMPDPGVIEVEGDANDRALRRYTDTPEEEWPGTRAALAAVFESDGSRPGCWIDPLMVASHINQTEKMKERSASGKKGAESRWHGSANSSAHGSAIRGANGTTDGGTGTGTGTGAGTGSGTGTEGPPTSLSVSSRSGISKEGASPESQEKIGVPKDVTARILQGSVRLRTRYPIRDAGGEQDASARPRGDVAHDPGAEEGPPEKVAPGSRGEGEVHDG